MYKKIWYYVPFLIIMAIIGMVYLKGSTVFPFKSSNLVGQQLPKFKAPFLDPLQDKLSDKNLKGHYTLLVFFASWCPHCHAQLPVLKEIAKKGDIDLIGVNINDDPKKLKAWFKENPLVFKKIVADPDKKLIKLFKVQSIPEIFLIDTTGIVLFHHKGSLTFVIMSQDILPKIKQIP